MGYMYCSAAFFMCSYEKGGNICLAYRELIKNFNKVRGYMRAFYVYGFKNRMGYAQGSPRTYDDEKRRVESWLGDYMGFQMTPEGKSVFLSIDSRSVRKNPLYRAWKACSFTDGDITLHFILFDLLADAQTELSLAEIVARITEYGKNFSNPKEFDITTVRKKLKEYEQLGLIDSQKHGKTVFYRRVKTILLPSQALLHFFSEVAPCGVVGSFLLDRNPMPFLNVFAFKHHYITHTLDSQILCTVLEAIHQQRNVTLTSIAKAQATHYVSNIVPLKIYVSVQNGRQYVMAYHLRLRTIKAYRLDDVETIQIGEIVPDFMQLQLKLSAMQPHIWGVMTRKNPRSTEQISFTIWYDSIREPYIKQRLLREKRCGTVEELDASHLRFSAQVYDAGELIPWIRTFLCRITAFSCSNPQIQNRWEQDLQAMYRLYDLAGEENI